jgi:hypothetical protein
MGKRTHALWGWRIAHVAVCAALLWGCGGEPDMQAEGGLDGSGATISYDAARAHPDRPCSLIAARDAQALTGRPYFDTLAKNLVEGARIRCALAVGEGAMQGLVQLDIVLPDAFAAGEAVLQRFCRPGAGQPPTLARPACLTTEGGYAGLIGERVYLAAVRREPGRINQALSLRLLDLVTPRAQALPKT